MNDDIQQSPVFYERVEYLGGNDKTKRGSSDKFYEITVEKDGQLYAETRKWGRYGADGTTKVIRHYSQAMAIASAKEQLRKKMKKGYTKPIGGLTRLAHAADDE